MRDQPGRASNGTLAGLMVRRRNRAQRLADKSGRGELFAIRQNRGRVAGQEKQSALNLFALRQEQSQTFACTAGFEKFCHWKLVTVVAALAKRADQLGRAFR